MLPVCASRGGGGGTVSLSATLDNLIFLFSHVFGRRATNTLETHACMFGCREKKFRESERVCMLCPIYTVVVQYLRGH
jgi:hypothetical protein